jgi:uncharacterized protein
MTFEQFITNNVFIAVIVSFITSQSIKLVIYSIKFKRLFHEILYKMYGGFPSTHTAIVTSLSFSVYFTDGITTLLYVLLTFSSFVIADVIHVRSLYKERDHVLNHIIRKSNINTKNKLPLLNTWVGHSIIEVVAGFTLGYLITYIAFFVI